MSKPVAWSFSRLNNYETCPRQYYEMNVARNFKDVGNEHTRYGTEVHKALQERVANGKRLPLHLTYLEPAAIKFAGATGEKLTEQQLAINRGFEPTDWFAQDVFCRVIIDLAIVNPPHAVLVDYKTGKNISNDFTQLKLAAAVFMLHVPDVKETTLAYYWTKHKKPTYQGLTRDGAGAVWAELLPRVKRLERAYEKHEWPAQPNNLCKRFCVVKTCPYHGT